MTHFIRDLHSEIRAQRFANPGAIIGSATPVAQHKEYLRMILIDLPSTPEITVPLNQVLKKRRSYNGGSSSPLSINHLSSLLHSSLGIEEINDGYKRRRYPSGGALYPIETYFIGTINDHTTAAHHYNPTKHQLEKLWDIDSESKLSDLTCNQDIVWGGLIIFTAVWNRGYVKYGNSTYLLSHLEAGHMAQNIQLCATALGINSRPLFGFSDEHIVDILDLDIEIEQPLYAIALSNPQ